MTFEEKEKILTFITQKLISPLFEDWRSGDTIWEEEHLSMFYKSQDFLENMIEENNKNKTFTEKLTQALKEKGLQMGYNNSGWYALSDIEKIGKEIENA